MWPWNRATLGHVYLLHFDRPIGNLANTRAMAMHYVGFAEDLEERLEKQLSGRGAALVRAAVAAGVQFTIYSWPAPLEVEKLIKARKRTADYCPSCAAAAGRTPMAIPSPSPYVQACLDLDSPLPEIAPRNGDFLEYRILAAWRRERTAYAPACDLERLDELL